MSSSIAQLLKCNALRGEELYAKAARVRCVDLASGECKLEPLDGSAAITAQLNAGPDWEASGGLRVVPKSGSVVIAVFVSPERAFVVCSSDLESFELRVGQHECVLNAEGLSLRVGEDLSLAVVLREVLDLQKNLLGLLQTLQLLSPAGNATMLPTTVLDLELLEGKLQKSESDLNRIFQT